MKFLVLLLTCLTSVAFAKTGDINCSFEYTSKANPEKFDLFFNVGDDKTFLIGQRTIKVATKRPQSLLTAKNYTLLTLGIWDDSGAVNTDQAAFYANEVLVQAETPAKFELHINRTGDLELNESYLVSCKRIK